MVGDSERHLPCKTIDYYSSTGEMEPWDRKTQPAPRREVWLPPPRAASWGSLGPIKHTDDGAPTFDGFSSSGRKSNALRSLSSHCQWRRLRS